MIFFSDATAHFPFLTIHFNVSCNTYISPSLLEPGSANPQCVKPITFSQVSVLPKPTLLSCHLGRPESRSKACLSCSSHFDPFYGQKVPKMAINAVFWP